MKTTPAKETIRTIETHYIDGAFVDSHGQEVMDIIRPTDGQVIARVMLGDEEYTRRAIAAAKRAFASFGQTTKEERSRYLRQLHKAVSGRICPASAENGARRSSVNINGEDACEKNASTTVQKRRLPS